MPGPSVAVGHPSTLATYPACCGEFEQVVLYRYGPAQVGLDQSDTFHIELAAPFKTEPTMPAAHTGTLGIERAETVPFDPGTWKSHHSRHENSESHIDVFRHNVHSIGFQVQSARMGLRSYYRHVHGSSRSRTGLLVYREKPKLPKFRPTWALCSCIGKTKFPKFCLLEASCSSSTWRGMPTVRIYPHAKRHFASPDCVENVLECPFAPCGPRFHAHFNLILGFAERQNLAFCIGCLTIINLSSMRILV